eukprot:15350813-Ditylum_brightwellii.AAC.1
MHGGNSFGVILILARMFLDDAVHRSVNDACAGFSCATDYGRNLPGKKSCWQLSFVWKLG